MAGGRGKSDAGRATGAYRPGLDGLRAIAVGAVVLFHLGWFPGGNLGVDAFFVISGWLITWRLLAAADRRSPTSGRIDLRHFWAGRVRRLMPASLTVIATVVVVWPLLSIAVPTLRRDALFALFWASNWGTITGGGNYWAKFADPSPLTHFWSLAIEEQFYLVWPLILTGVLMAAGRHRRRAVAATAGALATASIVFMVVSFEPAHRTATYMNTFARAHSLLLGAVAGALTVLGTDGLRGGRIARRLAPGAAAGALAIAVVASERSDWLFAWGFPVFAMLMVVVVVAVADGAAQRVLAARPMRWVGDRSYGIYLWHWPVIALATPARLHMNGVVLDVGRVVVSVLLAHLSFRFIEQPIRERRRLIAWRGPAAACAAVASVVLLAVALVPPPAHTTAASVVALATPRAPAPMVMATASRGEAPGTTLSASDAPVPRAAGGDAASAAVPAAATPPKPPLRVLVAGDSTAVHLADAFIPYSAAHPDQLLAGSAAFPGCGLSAATDGRLHHFTTADGQQQMIDLAGCVSEWNSIARRVAADEHFDIVLVSVGPWDGTDIQLADGRTVSVLDPVGALMIERMYQAFVAQVEAAGAQVVWVTPPDVTMRWGALKSPLDNPARWAALRAIVNRLPVEQIDLPHWFATTGLGGPAGRPDGVHMTPEVETRFVDEAVVPALLNRSLH